jgi:hypothetical protein
MKELMLSGILTPKTKASDKAFKDLRSAVQKTATRMDAEATLTLGKNGTVTMSVDKDEVAEAMVSTLKGLHNLTVSGVLTELEIYVQSMQAKPEQKPGK